MIITTMIMATRTRMRMAAIITTMTDAAIAITPPVGLYRLMAWLSPAYPVGGFTYSHGLESAVETGGVTTPATTTAYLATVLRRGGGWTDAVLFAACYRAAQEAVVSGNDEAVHAVADLAAAFRGTEETALESTQQGAAFVRTTRMAWPSARFEAFAEARKGRLVVYPVAVALACAETVALELALPAYLHALVANLVSAAVRLIPLGQTDGQRVLASLESVVAQVATLAQAADPAMLGSAAPLIDLHSIHHETQYTRLFRS
jgi:urease accessory protein